MQSRKLFLLLSCVFLYACSPKEEAKVVESSLFAHLHEIDYAIPENAKFIAGRVIGLDPGHGGDKGEKAIETKANLRVALLLEEMLISCGAKVVLTRREDVPIALAKRPQIVEKAGAEIFISLHHDAAGSKTVNRTSTWFHKSPDREPACLDLARAVQRRVAEALRTPMVIPTPLMSDSLRFKQGFAVLRACNIPAIICEASFYTNEEERKRLEHEDYLKRQAYGYLLGIIDYFSGGTPTAKIVNVKQIRSGRWQVKLFLDDGLKKRGGWGAESYRVLESSIQVRVDGKLVDFTYQPKKSELIFYLKSSKPTKLDVRFQNLYKQSNFPSRFELGKGKNNSSWRLSKAP